MYLSVHFLMIIVPDFTSYFIWMKYIQIKCTEQWEYSNIQNIILILDAIKK